MEEIEEGCNEQSSMNDDPFGWSIISSELAEDVRGLTAAEMLGEDFEQEAANIGALMLFSDLHIL